ncbi:SDR family NAD(P)-dependent oxidoreductase [Brachybacterium saurashtrense]|uniref:SDR family NAD(P)-dependent oxidoreductase n=1 Tax=Brachybacterium saurashtrense TaxID=556288 RepID=A0A345YS18_9MICO|nr:SDR family NAD(P)-dependent oxidoreductase [Brachybacterium saurashtrense]AXK46720.1 SDR family NAD(P)-dependent oxidoreductase [Brachybacterium saurashtrense]RRR22435.1 SDR family NAD(P)-dependent oxidoreductase [Brachybacterium saurashtrense]
MSRLASRTALVTGAASGIGLAVATRFAREGARVVIADRDADAARAAARALTAELGEGATLPLTVDISSEPSVKAGFAELAASGWSPDVVVANAGVQLFGQDAKIAELDLAVWQRTVDVNLTGTMLTVKHAVRAMLAAGGGSIILTGSPTGLTGEGNDFTSYATTKAGIHGLARTVAAAYAADGIRVNAVVPGYTETPLVTTISDDPAERGAIIGRIPMGRPGTPADVEGIMVFLASDDAAFATGALFRVDGGMTSV